MPDSITKPRYLGLDISHGATGWAVLNHRGQHLEHGVYIAADRKKFSPERLYRFMVWLRSIIISKKITHVGIEDITLTYPAVAKTLAYYHGAVIYLVLRRGLQFRRYATATWKSHWKIKDTLQIKSLKKSKRSAARKDQYAAVVFKHFKIKYNTLTDWARVSGHKLLTYQDKAAALAVAKTLFDDIQRGQP